MTPPRLEYGLRGPEEERRDLEVKRTASTRNARGRDDTTSRLRGRPKVRMEDYAQHFMVFGDVYAHQKALAAVEQKPDLDALWHPVHEQLVVALTKLRAARYSDVTVEGHAFPRDFMPGTVCPCSPKRVAKLQASCAILLSNGHLLLRGIEGLNQGDKCYKRFRSEVKFLLLATFICSGLQHGSEVLYDSVNRVNVQLNVSVPVAGGNV